MIGLPACPPWLVPGLGWVSGVQMPLPLFLCYRHREGPGPPGPGVPSSDSKFGPLPSGPARSHLESRIGAQPSEAGFREEGLGLGLGGCSFSQGV